MSETAKGDVLMYIVQAPKAQALAAESSSTLTAGDKMVTDFVAGRYFEVENFGFSIDLADDEGGGGGDGDSRSYARWRALKPTAPKPSPPFQAEPNDVTITRRIDIASPILLQNCLDTKQFDKAVIVKRAHIARSGRMFGMMRLEFSKVWIKAIEWEDGDTVKETCKFKFASVNITYVRLKPDGSAASTWPCNWDGPNYG